MKNKLKKIKRKIFLFLKSFGYSTLTEENLEKIMKRKEQELEDIDFLFEKETKRMKEEINKELSDYFSQEEIDQIYEKLIKED